MNISRRELLKNAGRATGVVLVGAASRSNSSSYVPETLPPLPDARTTGIEHVVVVSMENRHPELSWTGTVSGIRPTRSRAIMNGAGGSRR